MNKKFQRRYLIPAALCLLAALGVVYYYFFSSLSQRSETVYLYIDDDDDIDSVTTKLASIANKQPLYAFSTLARHSNYEEKVRTGRYAIEPGNGAITVFRHL